MLFDACCLPTSFSYIWLFLIIAEILNPLMLNWVIYSGVSLTSDNICGDNSFLDSQHGPV
jgi:hypothetical protein